MNGRNASSKCCSCRPRRRLTSWNAAAARSSSRSFGRLVWWIPCFTSDPARGQVPDLIEEIKKRAVRKERVLVTTLDQAPGRGLERLFSRSRAARQMAALGARRHRTRAGLARATRRGFRRAGRRQPAPRGAGSARGVARRHPRRGQGRIPAQRHVADPDNRPGSAQRQRRGDSVCRHA